MELYALESSYVLGFIDGEIAQEGIIPDKWKEKISGLFNRLKSEIPEKIRKAKDRAIEGLKYIGRSIAKKAGKNAQRFMDFITSSMKKGMDIGKGCLRVFKDIMTLIGTIPEVSKAAYKEKEVYVGIVESTTPGNNAKEKFDNKADDIEDLLEQLQESVNEQIRDIEDRKKRQEKMRKSLTESVDDDAIQELKSTAQRLQENRKKREKEFELKRGELTKWRNDLNAETDATLKKMQNIANESSRLADECAANSARLCDQAIKEAKNSGENTKSLFSRIIGLFSKLITVVVGVITLPLKLINGGSSGKK